jgi:riboflavin kinase/FMN adenylyltransferase
VRLYNNISEIVDLKNTILTIGTFDGVHLGHQKIIKKLVELKKKHGGETLLFTFDPHPRKILFPEQHDLKLITTTQEKCDLLNQFGIDNVLVFPFDLAFSKMNADEYVSEIIAKKLNTKIIVIGYDHRFGSNREGDINSLKRVSSDYNFDIEEISAEEINQLNISSTRIRKAIELGNIEEANNYLGYSFFITGEVVKGKQLGRTIGYPTANININDLDKIRPKNGVYAVNVIIENTTYKGMLNIGYNPTTDNNASQKIEVHIFNFNNDIYGQFIKIEFIQHLRNEIKFNNLDELKVQLANDKIACENI